MPRNARIDIPGLLHHVIVRGIDKRDIFLDDQDREDFISRFSSLLQDTGTRCFAWSLLGNHFHLLIRPEQGTLATFMRRLLTGYAVVFNLRHNRSGHLFQNRYKSIVCDEEPYLLELVRYIHLNPIRAGMIDCLEDLERFPWCGHAELAGKNNRGLIAQESILALFSQREQSARQRYKAYLADGFKDDRSQKLSRGGKRLSRALNPTLSEEELFDDRILGGGHFVEQLLDATGERQQGLPPSLAELVCLVAAHFGIDPDELYVPSKARRIVRAKALICYIAVRRLKIKGIEVAEFLGYSSTAVTHAVTRGGVIFAETPDLGEKLTARKL